MFKKVTSLSSRKRTFFYAGHLMGQQAIYKDLGRCAEEIGKASISMRQFQNRGMFMSLKMAQHDGNQAIIASQPYRQLSTSTRNMDGIQV